MIRKPWKFRLFKPSKLQVFSIQKKTLSKSRKTDLLWPEQLLERTIKNKVNGICQWNWVHKSDHQILNRISNHLKPNPVHKWARKPSECTRLRKNPSWSANSGLFPDIAIKISVLHSTDVFLWISSSLSLNRIYL